MIWRILFGLCLMMMVVSCAGAQELSDQAVNQLLKDNWQQYRDRFIQPDGRVIDHNTGITTSEGQSYGLLRAAWMRDKKTFDQVLVWTQQNLQKRNNDKLFAWKWGQKQDQSWGVLDSTAASDADQDIALALIFAHKIWGEDRYLNEAKLVLNDIWEKETTQTPIGRVLLPGDWKTDNRQIQINLSYFSPYAYRIFDDTDRKHAWEQLIKTSYKIVKDGMAQTKTHLPPDWMQLSTIDGSVSLYKDPTDTRSDYGYEAIRVFWRFGVDDLLNPTPESKAILTGAPFLVRYWQVRGEFPAVLSWDGIPRKDNLESAAVYGASLPAFYYLDENVTQEILTRKVIPNMKPDGQWNTDKDYYTQNWLWFGLATYDFMKRKVEYPKRLDPLERLEWLMDVK